MLFSSRPSYGNNRNRFANSEFDYLLRRQIIPWMRLIRLPNVLTAFGDSLGGACIASALSEQEMPYWSVLDVCFCSIVLYIFGLIQNDYCDVLEDSRLRPERPLPNRDISKAAAALVAIACLVVALLLSALTGRTTFIIALLLAVAISAYNIKLKRSLVSGSICMGLCRGLNMLLGASLVAIPPAILLPIIGVSLYIGFVTWLADGEKRRHIPTAKVFYPAITLAASWFLTLFFISGIYLWRAILPSLLCIAIAVFCAFMAAYAIYNRSVQPSAMRRFIGTLIGLLIPWQAAWIVFGTGTHWLMVLLLAGLTWLLMKCLSRWISQS